MKSDIEIAQASKIQPIVNIAKQIGIHEDDLELYGRYKAKLPLKLIDEEKVKKGRLILVTAITPTPAGEGKTTTSIGLTQALNKKRWCCRWWIFTSYSDGRYQFAFYR